MEHMEGSKFIICPWCGCNQEREIKIKEGGGKELECEKCNKEFFVEAHVEALFYCSHIVDAEFKEDKLDVEDDKDD